MIKKKGNEEVGCISWLLPTSTFLDVGVADNEEILRFDSFRDVWVLFYQVAGAVAGFSTRLPTPDLDFISKVKKKAKI